MRVHMTRLLGGHSVDPLTFVTLLENAGGNFIEGKQAVMDLALSAPTLAEMECKGIQASTSFFVAEGCLPGSGNGPRSRQNRKAVSNTQVMVKIRRSISDLAHAGDVARIRSDAFSVSFQ